MVRALFHFPEGLIAIGVVVLGIAVLCVFGLRIGWGQNGVTDSDRNLTVSNSGSYGTASFMSPKEASACFEVTSAKRTSQDILGMLPDGQVLTLPKDTRLNANLAVCGSSGTGKSRAISRNLVLQAVKRGESVILTDPKSELYESMGEYLRENGYIVKVFNLVEMDHSDSWNCLGEVGSSELMAQTFADIVLQNTSGDSKDAFWYNAELNLLKALVLYVALEMPPEKRNIATVYDLLYTQTEKGLSDMMASISPLMFWCPRTNGYWSPDSLRHLHKQMLAAAGVDESVRFHDLRHTFSTLAIQSGVDAKTVAGMLGHYSAAFTLDTYTHVTEQMKRGAAEKIGVFMNASVNVQVNVVHSPSAVVRGDYESDLANCLNPSNSTDLDPTSQ